jgi:hypothetical protein
MLPARRLADRPAVFFQPVALPHLSIPLNIFPRALIFAMLVPEKVCLFDPHPSYETPDDVMGNPKIHSRKTRMGHTASLCFF